MNPMAGGWLILLTLAFAMLLAVVHLPETWPAWLGWLRPVWAWRPSALPPIWITSG